MFTQDAVLLLGMLLIKGLQQGRSRGPSGSGAHVLSEDTFTRF